MNKNFVFIYISIIFVLLTSPFVNNNLNTVAMSNQINILSANFNGLTNISIACDRDLTDITKNDIIIKVNESQVNTSDILSITIDPSNNKRASIYLSPLAFENISSEGAKISFVNNATECIIQANDTPYNNNIKNILTVNENTFNDFIGSWNNLFNKTPIVLSKNSQGENTQIGTLNAVMIVIDFADALATNSIKKTAQEYYDYFIPNTKKFYTASSYGKMNFNMTLVKNPKDISGVYHLPKKTKKYGLPHDVKTYVDAAIKIAKKQLLALSNQYQSIYVFSVDSAIDVTNSSIEPNGQIANIALGQNKFKSLVRINGNNPWESDIMIHECTHTLGLPDLYISSFSGPIYGQSDPYIDKFFDIFPYTGGWDIMGKCDGPGNDLFGFHKWRLGWIRNDQVDIITKNGTTLHEITPIETVGGTKMIIIPGEKLGVTYAIEYRQAISPEKSGIIPGLLVYKIDADNDQTQGPIIVADVLKKTTSNTTKSLSNYLNDCVLGVNSGVFTFTDKSCGLFVSIPIVEPHSDVNAPMHVTIIKNTPSLDDKKPVLSDAHFIYPNAIELKTSYDLRGIVANEILITKNGDLVTDTQINQITPTTLRVTFNYNLVKSLSDMDGFQISTKAFSFFKASDKVAVTKPDASNIVQNLSNAIFTSPTEITAKILINNIREDSVKVIKGNGNIIPSHKITSVSNVDGNLIINFTSDQFISQNDYIGVKITSTITSNFDPQSMDLSQNKYNPNIEIYNNEVDVAPFNENN